jgi:hypothetical protein
MLPTVLAAVLAVPLAAHAASSSSSPEAPAFPAAAGVPGPLAPGTGTDLRPVFNLKYKGGTDMEFVTIKGRDYAVVPSERTSGGGIGMLRMIDITNPAKPKLTGVLSCNVTQNDVQVHGTIVWMGVDGSVRDDQCFQQAGAKPALGVVAVDISNPAKPRGVGFVPIAKGAHNTTVHPNGKFLYVSDSELTPYTSDAPGSQLGRINVIDVSNVKKMKEIYTLPLPTGLSSHDITFNTNGKTAYSAAITQTLVLDMENPAKPTIAHTIIDPAINISHGADPTPDGKYLLVTDEQAGAAANGVCNLGGVHVYDLTVPVPVKVGFYPFSPANSLLATTNSGNTTCTAHVLDYAPDGKTFSTAGYAAGVRIVDSTALIATPKELASFTALDADTWSAKTYKNKKYLFANDLARGFDVFEWVPGLGAVDTRTPAQKRFNVQRIGATMFMNGAWCAEPKAATKALHTH